jgi:agmatinase
VEPHLEASAHPFFGGRQPSDDGEDRSAFAYIGLPLPSAYDPVGQRSPAAGAPEHVRLMSWEQEAHTDHDHHDFDLGGPLMPSGAVPDLIDHGDVVGDPADLAATKRFATYVVRSALERGALPLAVGGDHSVAQVMVQGYEGFGPVNVLHVDAHLDFRDEVDGVRDGYSSPVRRIREMPWVGRILQVGMRGVGSARPQEVHDAIEAGNAIVTAEDLHERGVDQVLDHVTDEAPWYVTLDVDGLDPTIAPGTGYPTPGGITFRQAAAMIRGIAGRGLLAGIDANEIHPDIDVRGLTALTVLRLFALAMGSSVRAAGREDRALPVTVTRTT